MAKKEHVPIVMLAFDLGKKEVKTGEPLHPLDKWEENFEGYTDFMGEYSVRSRNPIFHRNP